MVKNLPAMQETQDPSLGREDPLEKGMATHSSLLAWRILWTEKPGRLQSVGSQSFKTERLKLSHRLHSGHQFFHYRFKVQAKIPGHIKSSGLLSLL